MLIAYFLILVIAGQEWPVLVGQDQRGQGFRTREACLAVMEWLEMTGFETGGCSVMSVPQESLVLNVGELPLNGGQHYARAK